MAWANQRKLWSIDSNGHCKITKYLKGGVPRFISYAGYPLWNSVWLLDTKFSIKVEIQRQPTTLLSTNFDEACSSMYLFSLYFHPIPLRIANYQFGLASLPY